MDNNELFNQIASLINAQNEVLDNRFQRMDQRLDRMDERFDRIEERLTKAEDLSRRTAAELRKTQIMIENDVAKRIDALFDGYKLNHEKQLELENQHQQLQRQIDGLQVRLAAVEAKPAG